MCSSYVRKFTLWKLQVVFLSIFMRQCIENNCVILKHFLPKETSFPVGSHCQLSFQVLTTSNLWTFHISGVIWYVAWPVWF
jgi:hypothetical protein